MNKPVYKIIDSKGRVLIPRELRGASGMDYGDIVRLDLQNGRVSVKKIDIVEIGDKSPEAVEAFVRAAIREMPEEKQIAIAARLLELLQQRKEGCHERRLPVPCVTIDVYFSLCFFHWRCCVPPPCPE